MDAARWRLVANGCAVLAVAAVFYAFAGYLACMNSVAEGMTRALSPVSEQELQLLVDQAIANVEEIPEPFSERAKIAHPVCIETESPLGKLEGWGFMIFGIIGFFFARNQAQIQRRERFNTQGGTPGRRITGVGGEERGPLPDQIDIGDVKVGLSDRDKEILEAVGDLDTRDDSLMLYLNKGKDKGKEEDIPRDIDGFFCPPGYHDKAILYVDPDHVAASDELAGEDPTNNADRPMETIGGAIKYARSLLKDGGSGVMIRVKPGVYHESIEIPDGCVVVNHHLPAEGSPRSRLPWLTDQNAEHPDSVTILTPPDAVFAINFEGGKNQGIFGCHIVGRENVKQAGIVAVSCRALAIMNCSVERFIGGGIRLQDSGTELAGGAVMIHGCRLTRNVSKKGGALYAERASVNIADCVFERNRALTGGAIYGVDLRAPLVIKKSRVSHNRAQLEESPAVEVDDRPLEQWQKEVGLGGGVYLLKSRLKVVAGEFVENGASVAGAGIALIGGKGLIEGDDAATSRVARNKSRVGGGVVVIGWAGANATLKISDSRFEKNKATLGGGGLAVIGIATVQVIDTEFEANEITDKEGYDGGAVAWNGGELLGSGAAFLENKSAGNGGGIAVINGRMTFKNDSRMRANVAGKGGGAIYAITTTSDVAAKLIQTKAVKIPFAVTLEKIKISNNSSSDLGGGLRGGNEVGVTTAPLGFKLGEGVRFQLNRTKSQRENADDVWVVWAGDVKANDRKLPEKLVLR